MHGEPSWCYLYRKMIGPLTSAGLPGHRARPGGLRSLGQARRPRRLHLRPPRRVDAGRALRRARRCPDLTLVGQDWGGLIGLRLVAEHPDRFRRVVAANTGLPTGDTGHGRGLPGLAEVLPGGARRCPWGASWAAGACPNSRPRWSRPTTRPFPDESYKEGARQFPVLVPSRPDDPAADANRRAWEVLRRVRQAVPVRLQRP